MQNDMYSKNKKTYAQFDANNFSESGLAPFAKLLEAEGAPVESINASNRAIRKDDAVFKKADFYFSNGQRVSLRVSGTGDIVAAALNGKSIPVKDASTLRSIAKELADYMKRGQAVFDKSLAKKLKAIKVDSSVRPASKTNQQRIDELNAAVVEAEKQYTQARDAFEQTSKAVQSLRETEAQLQQEVAAAISKGKELKLALKGLKS
jgi:hypothetical protein